MMRKMERVLAMALCLTIGMTLFPFRSFAETDIPAGDEIVNVAAETEAAAEGRLFEVPPETLPETVLEEEPEVIADEAALNEEQTGEEGAEIIPEEAAHSEGEENGDVSDFHENTTGEGSEDPAMTPDVLETQENVEPESALNPQKETEADPPAENTTGEVNSEAAAVASVETSPLEEKEAEENKEEEQTAELFEAVSLHDAEAEPIAPGETKQVVIDAGQFEDFVFTPSKDGKYIVSVDGATSDVYIHKYDNLGNSVNRKENRYTDHFYAGDKYYFSVYFVEPTTTGTFYISLAEAEFDNKLFAYPAGQRDNWWLQNISARIGTTVTLEVIAEANDTSGIIYTWYNAITSEKLNEMTNRLTVPVNSTTNIIHYECVVSDQYDESVEINFNVSGKAFNTRDDLAGLTIREIGLNETGSASLETEGEPAYFSYACSESGKYEIGTSPLAATTTVGYFSPDDGSFVEFSSVGGRQAGDKFISVYPLEAGTRYYVLCYFDPYSTDVQTGDVTMQINKAVPMADKATPITVGESVTAVLAAQGDVAYYSFTAEESGPYALIPDMIGTGRDDISTSITVYDEYENVLSYDHTAILEAGSTCYFAICLENGSDAAIPLQLFASNQLSVVADPSMSYVHTSEEVELYASVSAIDYSEINYAWTKEGSDQVIGTEDRLMVQSASAEGTTDVYLCTVSDQYGNSETARFNVVTVAFESIGDGSVFTVDCPVDLPEESPTYGAYRLDYFFKPNETGCYEFTADFSDGTAQGMVDASQPAVFGKDITQWKRIYEGETEFPDKGIVRAVLQADTEYRFEIMNETGSPLTFSTRVFPTDACGEEATWAYSDGTLTISGTGSVWYYSGIDYAWTEYADAITRIVIEEGITETPFLYNSYHYLDLYSQVSEIDLPASLVKLYAYIDGSRSNSDNLTLRYAGTKAQWAAVDKSECTLTDVTVLCSDGEAVEEVTWAFDEATGTLTVSGYGAIAAPSPWSNLKEQIRKVIMESGITSIEHEVFRGYTSLTTVEMPKGLTRIGALAFRDCSSLTEVEFPEGIRNIEYEAFRGCSSLAAVKIPEGLTSIEGYTFDGCETLNEVTIPTSVTRIEDYAFLGYSDTDVGTVYYSGTEDQWNAINIGAGNERLLNANIIFAEELGELTLEAVGGETIFTVDYGEKAELQVAATPARAGDQLSYSWTYTTDWTESGEPETAALTEAGSSIETEAIKRPYQYVCTVTDQRGKTASVEFSVDYLRPDGFVGNGISWSFDGSTLTLSGAGEVWDYYPNSGFLPPWAGAADQITGIDLNEGITVIGKSAFRRLVNVERVKIPVTVTEIGNDAFSGCEGLRNGRVRYAGLQEQWDKIEIGSGNEMLSEAEYYIEEGSCGDSLSWILKLNGELLISGTGNMWDYAAGEAPWYAYRGLVRSGILEDGAGSIGSNAFGDCVGMETVTIPESVSAIGAGCFQNCIALKSAAIPSRVTNIPESAFRSCASLSEIVIPDQVMAVGSYAFADCESARTVSIGRSLGEIGENAFFGCSAVQEYLVAEDNPLYYTEGSGGVLFENLDDGGYEKRLLVYPAGKTETFYEISGDVLEIADYAFCRCAFLKGVYISCLDAAISGNVFFECGALEYFTTDENTQDWAQYWSSNGILFRRDEEGGTILLSYPKGRGATSYEVPDGVTKIGAYAFFGCTELESVSLPAGLTEIGESAFRGSGLRELVLPESVTTIGVDAFNGCGLMESITLPENVSVGESAFYGCDNLETVYYAGSTALWESIRGTLGLEEARVFSSDGYDDSLWVSVSEPEPVLGGVVLKMESNAAVIYTLGQDRPGGKYLDYREDELEKNGILLDRAGTFSITARAVDEASGRYSDTVTVSITVERSGKPELAAENGSVAILTGAGTAADAEVYYTVDMGDEPTRQSYRYMAPVVLDKNIMLKAVVYEKGKAPSETEAKWFYAAEKQSGLTINTDTYSFRNRNAEVGLDVYQDVFKNSVLGRFFYDCYTPEYLCFGMSTTALLFKYGILQKDEYFDLSGGGSLYSASDPKRDDAGLMKQIQKYQVSQFLLKRLPVDEVPGIVEVSSGTPELNDAYLSVLAKACSGEEPMILFLNERHAVVPCRMEENRVYVYDCNYPGKEPYLTFTKVRGKEYYKFIYSEDPYYDNYLSYRLLSTLLEKLDGVQSGRVDVFAEAEEQIMLGMNSALFTILDAGGEEYSGYSPVETAADMVTENTVIQLGRGTYTLVNRDPGLKDWTVLAADEREYYRVTVSDPNARVEIGEENGHLYVTVRADSQANVRIKAYNAAGMENELEFTAAYVKVFTNGDDTMQVESSVPVMRVNGMAAVLNGKSSVRDTYLGTVSQESGSGALKAYVSGPRPEIRTDIAALADGPCTMTVLASDTGDAAIICAAGYDETGKMVLYRQAETVAGRNKYVFAIPGQAAEVRVFLLDKAKYVPMTDGLTIYRAE